MTQVTCSELNIKRENSSLFISCNYCLEQDKMLLNCPSYWILNHFGYIQSIPVVLIPPPKTILLKKRNVKFDQDNKAGSNPSASHKLP